MAQRHRRPDTRFDKLLEVDTNTSEADMGNIKVGDKATFTVDAFPQRVFHGTVTQRRQSPQTVQNVVTYDVVIDVHNSGLALVPGMTASTTIITDQRSDVIRVPNQALRYVPGGLFAVSTGGGATAEHRPPQVFVLRDERDQRGAEVRRTCAFGTFDRLGPAWGRSRGQASALAAVSSRQSATHFRIRPPTSVLGSLVQASTTGPSSEKMKTPSMPYARRSVSSACTGL